jgi:hypothetical protein
MCNLAISDFNIAVKLDWQYDTFFQTIPPGWEYQTAYTDAQPDHIYNRCYHIYHDYRIAQIWNNIRSIRILLHENIRDVLLAGLASNPPAFNKPEHTLQLQDSMQIMYKLQGEILASIPQHLGFISQLGLSSSNPFTSLYTTSQMPWSHFNEHSTEQFSTVRTAGPNFLLWPLWLAGSMDIASQQAQDFVVKMLRHIYQSMGVQQALVLSKFIETKSKLRNSSHA